MTLPRRSWALMALLMGSCGGGVSTAGLGDAGADGATGDAGSVAASLRTALAGAWSFDVDGADHSGNGLALELGGLHVGAARFGKGLVLSGEGTPIAQRPKDDPALNLNTGDFTVSFWINFAMTGAPQFVAVKGYDAGGWFVGWAQTAWAYGLPSPEGSTFKPAGSPTAGAFHHVVFERTGGMVEIFVDSATVGTATVADSAAPAASPFQVGGFAPGGVAMSHGMSVVNGVVDDLAIWHRALLPEERLYLATHAVP